MVSGQQRRMSHGWAGHDMVSQGASC
jgi:hypothetical protein